MIIFPRIAMLIHGNNAAYYKSSENRPIDVGEVKNPGPRQKLESFRGGWYFLGKSCAFRWKSIENPRIDAGDGWTETNGGQCGRFGSSFYRETAVRTPVQLCPAPFLEIRLIIFIRLVRTYGTVTKCLSVGNDQKIHLTRTLLEKYYSLVGVLVKFPIVTNSEQQVSILPGMFLRVFKE